MSEAHSEQASKILDPLVGTLLDEKYRIDSPIGAGGMGSVYRAHHVLMERNVAVKVLHEFFSSDPQGVQRFKQEAEALKRLSHANIVAFYGFGFDALERPYIVMELVHGTTLKDILKQRGPLPAETVRTILLQVLSALEHAHAQNLVHRDLKPDNIFLCCDNGADPLASPQVKLLDFGIAKVLDGGSQKLTKTGVLLGTPLYMSPEVCSAQTAVPESDIYSLGCIAYECLSGQPPFTGDTLLAVAYAHCNDAVPPISTPNHPVPHDLETVILKAMCKDPSQRFHSAEEFAATLRSHSPVHVAPRTARLDLTFTPRMKKWCLALASFVLLGIVAVAAMNAMKHERSEKIRALCVEAESMRRSDRDTWQDEQTPNMPQIAAKLQEASGLVRTPEERADVISTMHTVIQDYRGLSPHNDKHQSQAEIRALAAVCKNELDMLSGAMDRESIGEKLRAYNVLVRLSSIDRVNSRSYAPYAVSGLQLIIEHKDQVETDDAVSLLRASMALVYLLEYGPDEDPQAALSILEPQELILDKQLVPHFIPKDLISTRKQIEAIRTTGRPMHKAELDGYLRELQREGRLYLTK